MIFFFLNTDSKNTDKKESSCFYWIDSYKILF